MQSRLHSIAETISNLVAGFFIQLVIYLWVLPKFMGITITPRQSVDLYIIFTVISVLRQYVVRRMFNWVDVRREREELRQMINRIEMGEDFTKGWRK